MKKNKLLKLVAIAALLSVACTESEMIRMDNQRHPKQEVYNGDVITSDTDTDVNNKWLSLKNAVVGINEITSSIAGGTGLLVGPRLVLTAAHVGSHCANNPDGNDCWFNDEKQSCVSDLGVFVGNDSRPWARLETLNVVDEIEHPNYCGTGYSGNGPDLGFWVLQHPPVNALPYTGGFEGNKEISWSTPMDFYGFGTEQSIVDGPLRRAECVRSSNTIMSDRGMSFEMSCQNAAGGDANGELGDSGGPVFDSNYEVVGLHSGSPGLIDSKVIDYGSIDAVVGDNYASWIEDMRDAYETELITGDFNGDGMGDLLHYNRNDRGSWIDLSPSSTEFPNGTNFQTFNWCTNDLMVGDFNNDDRDDILCNRGDRIFVILAKPNGGFVGGIFDWFDVACDGDLHVGDFNGDGYDDLYCREGSSRSINLNNGNFYTAFDGGWGWIETNNWCGTGELFFQDINDDDRTDIACWLPGTAVYVDYATSAGDFSGIHIRMGSGWCGGETQLRDIKDLNGDGRADLYCRWPGGHKTYIEWAGTDTNQPFDFAGYWTSLGFFWCDGSEQVQFIDDMDGDGEADAVCYHPPTAKTLIEPHHESSHFNGASYFKIPDLW
ncbi:MAG: trypsin-like serine protease [Deltaproteobacteria bacterium]|nr:trypsin-like serine protease [Deltaproteobacteria bacterium]